MSSLGVVQAKNTSRPAVDFFEPDNEGRVAVILRSRAVESHGIVFDKEDKGIRSVLARKTRFEQHFSRLLNEMSREANRRKPAKFKDPSLRSLRVSQIELEQLIANPTVDVHPNLWHRPALDASVPLVFPNQGTAAFDGAGATVVLLDSGVDDSHSFLSGALIDSQSACFSNDDNGVGSVPGGVSLCPGGVGSFIGAAAGDACDANIDDCQHGTQMAGIIAGEGSGISGVASGASIIPIQVATKSTDESVCGDPGLTPCIGFLTTDLIRALEYVATIARRWAYHQSLIPPNQATHQFDMGWIWQSVFLPLSRHRLLSFPV